MTRLALPVFSFDDSAVKSRGMVQLMIEMAELLERLAKGERVAPEEARSIKECLQEIREDMLRARQEQAGAGRRQVTRPRPVRRVLSTPAAAFAAARSSNAVSRQSHHNTVPARRTVLGLLPVFFRPGEGPTTAVQIARGS